MTVRQPIEFDAKTFFRGLTAEQLIWLSKKENHMNCKECPFACHTVEWMDVIEACGYANCVIENIHEDWWKK